MSISSDFKGGRRRGDVSDRNQNQDRELNEGVKTCKLNSSVNPHLFGPVLLSACIRILHHSTV